MNDENTLYPTGPMEDSEGQEGETDEMLNSVLRAIYAAKKEAKTKVVDLGRVVFCAEVFLAVVGLMQEDGANQHETLAAVYAGVPEDGRDVTHEAITVLVERYPDMSLRDTTLHCVQKLRQATDF